MTDFHHNVNRDFDLIGRNELIGSVLQVGDGRGFVVRANDIPYVITAAHCLPFLPPPHLGRFMEEETYPRLIGPLGADQSITATCVFADPVADLAVLGPPDNQGDDYDPYMALLSTLPPFDIAAPPRVRVCVCVSGYPGYPTSRPVLSFTKYPSRRASYRSTAPGGIAPPAISAGRW
jgi:hypothetical protein